MMSYIEYVYLDTLVAYQPTNSYQQQRKLVAYQPLLLLHQDQFHYNPLVIK